MNIPRAPKYPDGRLQTRLLAAAGILAALLLVLLWVRLGRSPKLADTATLAHPPATNAPGTTRVEFLSPSDYAITLSPEDRNMPERPVLNPLLPGARISEELSRSSREQAEHAITNFIANAKRAGLKIDVVGDAHMVVRSGKNRIASVHTDNTYFGATTSPTDAFTAAVDCMQCTGDDTNGVARNIMRLMSGSGASPSLKSLADQSQYPLVTTASEAYTAVETFLALQVPDGGYVLNKQWQLQLPSKLPFVEYEFVTPDDKGKIEPVDVVTVIVRVGGKDLKPGEAALAAYENTGVVTHKEHRAFPKPRTPLSAAP
jgi:hypothetical protein